MGFESWQAFYESAFQGLWALLVAPFLFLVYLFFRGVDPDARRRAPIERFIRIYCAVFALETLLDPIATGPLSRALELPGGAAQALALGFVLLGDFRVYLLVFHVGREERGLLRSVGWAALFTAIVPLVAQAAFQALGAVLESPPGQARWLIYEAAFACVAVYLGSRWVPRHVRHPARRHYLRLVTRYVATYYTLWAVADVLILAGIDGGWGLRALPNQLYYAFFVPFAYLAFPVAPGRA